jgi:TetR/AcrR family transcriptional regulator, transcriptional repressor for nem operon
MAGMTPTFLISARSSTAVKLDNIPTGRYPLSMRTKPSPRDSEATRQKIVQAAFAEFYKNGFQGGSLNQIVATAGTTKGALFHHFSGKQELGYAVVDEVIGPLLMQRWLAPLEGSADSIGTLKHAFRTFVKDDIESGAWAQGCPLNNLAQEMSPLDEGFRTRIDRLYTLWRKGFATALADGAKAGTVKKDVAPRSVAAMLVAGQMGIWGTGKNSQSKAVMTQATDALCGYLDSLKPPSL